MKFAEIKVAADVNSSWCKLFKAKLHVKLLKLTAESVTMIEGE